MEIATDVSIIIPHYNTPLYLRNLLETIPQMNNIQIIVVDDRSNKDIDEYTSVVYDYSYVQFYVNSNGPKGAGTCRNIGLQHALGKWILFADADDFFVDGFYDKLKPFLYSEYDVVYFMPTGVDRDTLAPCARHLYYKHILTQYIKIPNRRHELQVRYLISPPWSKLLRRGLIEEHKLLFEEVICSNDIAFATALGHYMMNFKVVCDTIYCVTESRTSLTKNRSNDNYNTLLGVFIRRYTFLKQHLQSKDFRQLDMLNMIAVMKLMSVVPKKLGWRMFFKVIRNFHANDVRIYNLRWLNPMYLFRLFILSLRVKTMK